MVHLYKFTYTITVYAKKVKVVCYCMSSVLDGLLQQGCNHTVPAAKEKLDKYLNQKAHDQFDE